MMDYEISAKRNWCGVTHHAGCACHEKARNEEIEHLRARLKDAEVIVDEFIYLASRATPTAMRGTPKGFFPIHADFYRQDDIDCEWEFHEEEVRQAIEQAKEFFKEGENKA
jgi:hypothetical protein